MVARRAHNPKVVGSSPASATKKIQLTFWGVGFFLVVQNDIEFAVSGYEIDERGSLGEVASAPYG